MYVRRHRRTLLVGAAVAAVLAGTTGAAVAESAPSPAATPTGDGAQALCKRAPKIDRRIQRALDRLNAGADKRGSIARLQQRVDNAKSAGHSEIATYLQDRLTFRKSLVTTLRQRQQDLADVRTWCKDNDGGAS
ncbi:MULTISPECIES: hypothetical protein [Streptomyces]|uniref:Secreted protein n=1 Tax=Streptomyces gilvifuscus TaxID=1550617 RepID=A0ABT5G8A6_9ACTN|nr:MULTISPECIES: hypothetical protein [Streptomyces]MBK3640831.1 hypothetical protein [Streptomyces sp. MBT33]MDC2960901.1 hypothetical protein [Streptomyces gilvifuscus]